MQAWQLNNFGKQAYFTNADGELMDQAVNVGCMGCGKTHTIMEAFGLYCLQLREEGYRDFRFALVGKTLNAIKKNMLNVLSQLYGDNFKYDHSTSSGQVCDARLFGFPLFFVPLNDTHAEARIRGLSDITGVILDEHVLIPEDQYALLLGRIRSERKLPYPYMNEWLISSTNPDSPSHWLLKNYINKGAVKLIQWHHRDAGWSGFKNYITRLAKMYRHMPAFFQRYILGRWTVAEGLVFSAFNAKVNVVDDGSAVDYNYVQRSWISIDYGSNHKTSVQVHHITYQGIRLIERNKTFERTSISKIVDYMLEQYDNVRSLSNIRPVNIYVDSAAQAVIDECRDRGVEALNAKKDVTAGNAYVNALFEAGQLIILLNEGTQELLDEIYSYKYDDRENAKDGAVVKIGDDCCDALRYGVYSDAKYNGLI